VNIPGLWTQLGFPATRLNWPSETISPIIRKRSDQRHLKMKPDLHFNSTAMICLLKNNAWPLNLKLWNSLLKV
jgi:hypothetical protein